MTKRPTLATLKSFIRKNQGNLMIKCNSSFDGMTDCVQQNRHAAYRPIKPIDRTGCAFKPADGQFDNTLGINGVWLVGSSRDYIKEINVNGLFGYEVYNCCGCFELVIETAPPKTSHIMDEAIAYHDLGHDWSSALAMANID